MTSIWFAGGALYHSENRGTSVRSKEEEERKLYYMKYKTFWWKTGSLFNRYTITMCVAQFHLTRNRIPPGLLSWEFTPSTDSPAQYRQLLSLCSCRPVSSEPSICCCSARLTAISSVILIWARSLAGQHSSLGPEDTHSSHWTYLSWYRLKHGSQHRLPSTNFYWFCCTLCPWFPALLTRH